MVESQAPDLETEVAVKYTQAWAMSQNSLERKAEMGTLFRLVMAPCGVHAYH